MIICGILVAGTVAGTLMVQPDYFAALVGTLSFGYIPPIPDSAPPDVRQQPILAITTTFGYVGGSVMCYIAYANWVCKHRWGLCSHRDIDQIRERAAAGRPGDYLPDDPREAKRLRRLVAPLRWDVALGAIVLFVVSASFMIAGAEVLSGGEHGQAFEGWSLLTDQGQIWHSIHPALVWVYYVCVLAALMGHSSVVPGDLFPCDARISHGYLARTIHPLSPRPAICLRLRPAHGGTAGVEPRAIRHAGERRIVPGHNRRRGAGDAGRVVPRFSASAEVPHAKVDARCRVRFGCNPAGHHCGERLVLGAQLDVCVVASSCHLLWINRRCAGRRRALA